VTYGELDPETGLRQHGMFYKVAYIVAVILPRPLLTLGGIGAGAYIFVREPWLGLLWACLAGAGILLFGVSKIMDFDELHGFPGAWRTMAFGIVSVVLGAGVVAVGFVLGAG
jgi:hypothetical protein